MSGEHVSTKAIRALITASGNNGRRYVPGSLYLVGSHMDWTERCAKTRCPHANNECYSARGGRFPDLTEPPAASGAESDHGGRRDGEGLA